MFFIIVTQLLELQVPVFLIGFEIETNLVEFRCSFRLHSFFLEYETLLIDPVGQCRVFLVLSWHFTCNAGREEGRVLVEAFKDKGKMVDSPKQLTMTMLSMKVLQLLELQIPNILVRHALGIEIEANFVEHQSSFRFHSARS
jgi:hypothetical protein